MNEFIAQEVARFLSDPIMRGIGYATGISLLGFPVIKKFNLDFGVSEQTSRLVQSVLAASVIAVTASLFRSNSVGHGSAFVIGYLVVYSIIFERWTKLPDAGLGFASMLVAYSGFSAALAGENMYVIGPIIGVAALVSIFAGLGFYDEVQSYRLEGKAAGKKKAAAPVSGPIVTRGPPRRD